ncbi:MAG: DNA primase [Eubacteriales bacterium]|nr:DNA primase [Eubacteriales bacterium]
MALNENFLQELKFKTDIEDIISTYVTLKKRGNTSVGLCPFHNEKTPSFTVYNDTQSFYCFGCGAGGDAIGFIRKIENLDYIDAVKLLAQRAGMQMPQDGFDDSISKKRRRILEINRESAKFFHSYMMSEQGRVGLEYFLNRGLTKKTITKFGLGYAPDSWGSLLKHLKSLGYGIGEMVDAGVVKVGRNNNYYDTFKNRVITPIIDVRGNVIAFGGRVLDDSKPKYVNTSDTLVYKKTNELFALNLAKDSGKDTLILCEGYMDVISMHQAGFTNAVAGCGTALTSEQVRLISRYANEVILAYDADEAGQKAVHKAMNLFKTTDVKIKVPKFVGGKDPDEIIKKLGRDKFKGMLEGATNDTEFALLEIKDKYDISTTQGKIDFVGDALKVIASLQPVEQDIYLSRISNELSIEKSSLKLQLSTIVKLKKNREKKSRYKTIINDYTRNEARKTYDTGISTRQSKAESRLLTLLIYYPDCTKLLNNFDSSRLSDGFVKKAYAALLERINDGLDFDLMTLGEQFSDTDYAKFSKLMNTNIDSANPKEEFKDCLNIINEEYEKKNSSSPSGMSEDEFRNLFSKINK